MWPFTRKSRPVHPPAPSEAGPPPEPEPPERSEPPEPPEPPRRRAAMELPLFSTVARDRALLAGDDTVPVVGGADHQPALWLAAGGQIAGDLPGITVTAALTVEPDTVRVDVVLGEQATTVGYLAEPACRAELDRLTVLGRQPVCQAMITGGEQDRDYRLFLRLPRP